MSLVSWPQRTERYGVEMMEHNYHDNGSCWCKPEVVQPFKDQEDHPSQYAFGWRHHYPGHECKCPSCAPVGFALGDPTWDVENANGEHPQEIALDGEKLPSVLRFREGDDGWAIFLTREGAGKIHACERCFGAGCQQALHGHVTVKWGAEVPA